MFLYRISQDVNDDYNTYDSAVVCAESEEEARMMHPAKFSYDDYEEWDGKDEEFSTWCAAKDVQVEIIGTAANNLPKGIVIASYNAA